MTRRLAALALPSLLMVAHALADGPADNIPAQVRPVPPPGVAVPDEDRKELEIGVARLGRAIARLDRAPADLKADVTVYHKAVHDALAYREFFAPADIARAKALIQEGLERADQLMVGQPVWTSKTGPVVRGYVSKIDGSVQPYGVVVPPSYDPKGPAKYRVDFWFHGRGETLSEVNFLDDRRKNPGQFTPPDTIVVHPYGRYCNANKFAGEIDALEILDHLRRQYRIDEERIGVRGFSMGGAACWQFAVHYADKWYAAAPGAGFSETPRFLDVFQKEKLEPTWFEKKLWRMYDCDLCAANLLNLPVVAYSGELDSQKQAADVMAEALKPLGVELTHIIGPQTKHAYHPESKREVDRIMDQLAARGRPQDPTTVELTTYTLRYNQMHWLAIDGLGEHWERAHARAEILKPPGENSPSIRIRAENVTRLSLCFPPGNTLLGASGSPRLWVNGQEIPATPLLGSDRSWCLVVELDGKTWQMAAPPNPRRKWHGLQGPIDDAFMDAFVFVRPTGESRHPKVAAWADAEFKRAVDHWRKQFRGDARVVDDTKLTDKQIAGMNLVLWGDPDSNAVLKRIADKLPIAWGGETIKVGDRSFPAEDHAAILIYPNPLNPSKYVVFNSGFTFRDYDYLNNARQVPKLPDWAIIDLKTPPDSRWPGKVADADFFDEQWGLRPARK